MASCPLETTADLDGIFIIVNPKASNVRAWTHDLCTGSLPVYLQTYVDGQKLKMKSLPIQAGRISHCSSAVVYYKNLVRSGKQQTHPLKQDENKSTAFPTCTQWLPVAFDKSVSSRLQSLLP